jgi:uncharacterized protein (TIGR02996 family)
MNNVYARRIKRQTRSAERQSALGEECADLDLIRVEEQALAFYSERIDRIPEIPLMRAMCGAKIDPAQMIYPAPKLRGSLRTLVRSLVSDLFQSRIFREHVQAGKDFRTAMEAARLSWTPCGRFMDRVAEVGLPRAALWWIDKSTPAYEDDYYESYAWSEWRWEDLCPLNEVLPDRFTFLRDGLSDPDPKWRAIAVRCLPRHAPRDADVIALLLGCLTDTHAPLRWWAAFHLTRLAPQTPGLSGVLAEAMATPWKSEGSIPNRGDCAAALARIEPAALDAVVASGGDGAVVGLSHDDPAVILATIRSIVRVGVVPPGAIEELVHLQSDNWPDRQEVAQAAREALDDLASRWKQGAGLEAPSLHDGFLLAVWANPEDELVRLVLADWFEDQGDPRGEFIRLDTALSRMDRDDVHRRELELRMETLRRQGALYGYHHFWERLTRRGAPADASIGGAVPSQG